MGTYNFDKNLLKVDEGVWGVKTVNLRHVVSYKLTEIGTIRGSNTSLYREVVFTMANGDDIKVDVMDHRDDKGLRNFIRELDKKLNEIN